METTSEDTSWLHLSWKNRFWLQDTGRLATIFRKMPNPNQQTPQLLHFIGSTAKNKLMQNLFPDDYDRPSPMSTLTALRVLESTVNSASPLLVADSNPFIEPQSLYLAPDYVSHEVKWTSTSTSHAIDILLARCSFLFSDVICISVADFPDFRSLVVRLIDWAKEARESALPSTLPPTVVLVFSGPGRQQQIEDYINAPEWAEIGGVFRLPPPFHLNEDHDQEHIQLRQALISHLQENHNQRRERGSPMSCNHFEAFYRLALEHVARTGMDPFDFINATRIDNPVGEDLADHVRNFLRLGLELRISYTDLASFIASAIIMDAYPPGMHRKPLSQLVRFS